MRKLFTLTLAAQLVAVSAGAQTDGSAGQQPAPETSAGIVPETGTGVGPGTSPGEFGGDWSMILGSAMFDMDGRTVRSKDELLGQWGTLSEEDRDIIRRDCAVLEEQADETRGEGSAAPVSPDTPGSGGATPEMGAGPATGADAAADAAGTSGSTGAAQSGLPIMIDVSMEQMEEICAVLGDYL